MFLLAGDPAGGRLITDLTHVQPDSTYYAGYANAERAEPDRLAGQHRLRPRRQSVDRHRRHAAARRNDGCWVCPTERSAARPLAAVHERRRSARRSAAASFTPDGETLFLSIQHPGEGGSVRRADQPLAGWAGDAAALERDRDQEGAAAETVGSCQSTLPGFMMPFGSSACLIERISSIATGRLVAQQLSRLSRPMPCSALKLPP